LIEGPKKLNVSQTANGFLGAPVNTKLLVVPLFTALTTCIDATFEAMDVWIGWAPLRQKFEVTRSDMFGK